MSLPTPTVRDVSDNILAQLEAALGQSTPLLPKAFARVLAKSLAGVYVLLWKYAGFIFLQMFVSTASWKETSINEKTVRPLVEWGRLIGVGDPRPATRAELLVEVSVAEFGGALAAGAQLVRSSTGVVYVTLATAALERPSVEVAVRAVSDPSGGSGAGIIGNLRPGDTLTFASPLADVDREARVVAQLVTGSEAETESAYRRRVVERFQRRPQGGAYADFRAWGTEPSGIVRVYPYTGTPGQIDLYVEATPESSGDPDGIPGPAQLDAVLDAVTAEVDGLASRRAVGQAVNVRPITRQPFRVEVNGLTSDDPIVAHEVIEAALDEHLRSREPFLVGLSVLPRQDRITVAALGGVAEEAASALGVTIAEVRLYEGPDEITARTLPRGTKAKLGSVFYT